MNSWSASYWATEQQQAELHGCAGWLFFIGYWSFMYEFIYLNYLFCEVFFSFWWLQLWLFYLLVPEELLLVVWIACWFYRQATIIHSWSEIVSIYFLLVCFPFFVLALFLFCCFSLFLYWSNVWITSWFYCWWHVSISTVAELFDWRAHHILYYSRATQEQQVVLQSKPFLLYYSRRCMCLFLFVASFFSCVFFVSFMLLFCLSIIMVCWKTYWLFVDYVMVWLILLMFLFVLLLLLWIVLIHGCSINHNIDRWILLPEMYKSNYYNKQRWRLSSLPDSSEY